MLDQLPLLVLLLQLLIKSLVPLVQTVVVILSHQLKLLLSLIPLLNHKLIQISNKIHLVGDTGGGTEEGTKELLFPMLNMSQQNNLIQLL